jgi:hypothetical protein
MIKFQVKDYRLELDPITLAISAFAELFNYDKTKGKAQGLQDLSYVYFVADEESPFANTDLADRDRVVRRSVYRDETYQFEPVRQRLVTDAVAYYKFLNDTVEGRIMASLDKRIDSVQSFLDEDIEIKDAAMLKQQVDLMTMVTNMLNEKSKLKEVIAKSGKTKIRNKAGAESSPREKGLLNLQRIREQRAATAEKAPETTQEAESYPDINEDGSYRYPDDAAAPMVPPLDLKGIAQDAIASAQQLLTQTPDELADIGAVLKQMAPASEHDGIDAQIEKMVKRDDRRNTRRVTAGTGATAKPITAIPSPQDDF